MRPLFIFQRSPDSLSTYICIFANPPIEIASAEDQRKRERDASSQDTRSRRYVAEDKAPISYIRLLALLDEEPVAFRSPREHESYSERPVLERLGFASAMSSAKRTKGDPLQTAKCVTCCFRTMSSSSFPYDSRLFRNPNDNDDNSTTDSFQVSLSSSRRRQRFRSPFSAEFRVFSPFQR